MCVYPASQVQMIFTKVSKVGAILKVVCGVNTGLNSVERAAQCQVYFLAGLLAAIEIHVAMQALMAADA
jgi:hypothetical protein